MFNPANDLRWTGGITSSTPSQPGEMAEGGSVERTARFLGRTFTYGYLVTKKEPDRLVEMSVTRPFPMLVRYELKTRMTAPSWPFAHRARPDVSSRLPRHC